MPSRKIIATLAALLAAIVGGWVVVHRLQNNATDSEPIGVDSKGSTEISVAGIRTVANAKVNPNNDEWPTEVAHDAVKKQLAKLQAVVESNQLEKLDSLHAESFSAKSYSAADLDPAFDDGNITVFRPKTDSTTRVEFQSLRDFIRNFLTNSTSEAERIAFKVIGISSTDGGVTTRVLTELRSRSHDATEQTNAVWECTWELGDAPKLKSVQVGMFERAHKRNGNPIFTDITPTVLGNTKDYSEHVLRGIDHWNQRLTGIDDMHIYGHHGVALGDVNGDGLEDLYVCDSGGLPNRLFIHNSDGTVADFSKQSNANWLEASTSALFVDFDNDGDQDLIVATIAGLLFAENSGSGVYQIRNAFTGVPEAHSMCAADYDNDGDLDVYVCNYGSSGGPGSKRGYEGAVPIPYNDANNGGANLLLRNDGSFRVSDVTQTLGLDQNNRRFSFAASWEDFDQDGDADLYVANDFGRNNLYENDRGRFRDIAASAGVEDMAGGMSVSWGDFNRDGYMDIYVGNMFSAAGNRVSYQRQFTERHARSSAGMQRMARGNTLFASNGKRAFIDVSEAAGVTMGRWAWSSSFADLNNDGWQDLLVANGYFTNESTNDL